ncbi:MAG: deoxyribodipyrimidine photo-lyase/cryptochrome family protein, partial [Myxococcota bacterium]|nr:deoxyribodipyrimidine photo-lyase/cryptochrome family protein [Myxococcota bacterium]
ELEDNLQRLGGRLIYAVGRMPDILEELHRSIAFKALWSHEETGNHVTFMRDLRVKDWCASKGVVWTEHYQTGVTRRLRQRDGWAKRWNARMTRSVLSAPNAIQAPDVALPALFQGPRRSVSALGLSPSRKHNVQQGGESKATQALDTFLTERGVNYRADMSSPVEGWTGCSRISPYLAWGAISMKTIHHATEARTQRVRVLRKAGRDIDPRWAKSLESYAGRLRWHCHFMQKLESEPRLEFHNVNRAFDGMREDAFDDRKFSAWCSGNTGFPMVDACMRALHQSGWINFRMRAMLMSFASYQLWLHWRPTAVYLAQHFLDFEPGIHFTQAQMQAGVTGINTIRIYSPKKQQLDQDPSGVFVRKYIPQLTHVPDKYLAEPHLMPQSVQSIAKCRIGIDYPKPVIDHGKAYKDAKAKIGSWRRTKSARSEAKRVYKKHGSRRSPGTRPWDRRPKAKRVKRPTQGELPLD